MFAEEESPLHFVIDRSEDCLVVGRLSILRYRFVACADYTECKEESVR